MRDTLIHKLETYSAKHPSVVLLTGDHGNALFSSFKKNNKDRFINCGIAEQNMICVAAGLSKVGFTPFVYALASFMPTRTIEQIKLSIAYQKQKVILLGDGAGFVYGPLGSSHHSCEDIACMRAIPDINIYSPSGPEEMAWALDSALENTNASYIRIGRASDYLDTSNTTITSGFRKIVDNSSKQNKIALIATGSMVAAAEDVGKSLDLDIDVYSITQLKPTPDALINNNWHEYRAVVTIEEHSIIGGMGSMVNEALSQKRQLPILNIGVPDRFVKLCGSYEYLRDSFNLTNTKIAQKIITFLDDI